MATAHLIHGYIGTGKTSLAIHLERVVGGVRFSADEWYLRLYAGDEPTWHLDATWSDRLMALLDDVWPRLLAHGVDVVLDFGFWSRGSREAARILALGVGAETRLYAVVCADEVARARCLSRNADPGRSFVIDEAAFEALRVKFEPLGPDEVFDLVDTTEAPELI